jgi:hypothetical protein
MIFRFIAVEGAGHWVQMESQETTAIDLAVLRTLNHIALNWLSTFSLGAILLGIWLPSRPRR